MRANAEIAAVFKAVADAYSPATISGLIALPSAV